MLVTHLSLFFLHSGRWIGNSQHCFSPLFTLPSSPPPLAPSECQIKGMGERSGASHGASRALQTPLSLPLPLRPINPCRK